MKRIRIPLGILFAILTAVPMYAQEQDAPQATPQAKEIHPPRIPVAGDVQDKNVVHRVFANYPMATGKRMTGTVVLHVIISQDGTVQKLDAVSGPENLRQSALDAVKQWKYRPAMLNGQPVEVETTVNVIFSLDVPTADQPPPTPPEIPSDANAAALNAIDVASAPPPPMRSPPSRIKVGGKVQAAMLVHQVLPIYPIYAKDEHISGTVLLHVIIARDGSIQTVEFVSGPDEMKKSAIDAVKQWRYRPTTLNGQPIEVDTTVQVVYSLGGG
jgi:TonB family protein